MSPSSSDVIDDLGETNLSSGGVAGFITEAEIWYNSELPDGVTLDTNVKDLVIQKLAAHLIKTGPERQVESSDPAGVDYAGEFGVGLEQTSYGQTAIQIDPENVLGPTDTRPGASVASPDVKGVD